MSITTVTNGQLVYMKAEGISAPHAFTTRLGGVSQDYLSSLNLGTSRGDTFENVLKNYQILGNALSFSPEDLVLSHQTHTDIVRRVYRSDRGTGLLAPPFPDCDALITNDPHVALVVFTADCTPILFHDPVTGAVGAAHAGWRGTASGIAKKTVAAMVAAYGCTPENIRAAIGPNIGPCCFETDKDVPEAILSSLGPQAEAFIRSSGGKYYVNLKEINALWLRDAGVTHIEISALCTACRTDLFWSHRKMGSLRGSQGAVIVRKEKD